MNNEIKTKYNEKLNGTMKKLLSGIEQLPEDMATEIVTEVQEYLLGKLIDVNEDLREMELERSTQIFR